MSALLADRHPDLRQALSSYTDRLREAVVRIAHPARYDAGCLVLERAEQTVRHIAAGHLTGPGIDLAILLLNDLARANDLPAYRI